MNDDAILLRRYAEEGSDAAFTELVRRHVDLVYGAALRRTGGDSHRARDVAQEVFTALARNARRLAGHAVLSAWLHTATRNAALNLMISDQRRKARETEAAAAAPIPEWDRLRPLLDASIDELPEPDRVALVLRFLERRAFAEIGAALRVSEDAARMRTDRALEKLRVALARRGVTSTASALGLLVSSQPVVAAPAGLAATLAAQSMVAASSGMLATSLFSLMSTKLITTAIASALIAFWLGTRINSGSTASPEASATLAAESQRQEQVVASLRKDNQRLRLQADALETEMARLKESQAAAVTKPVAPSAPGPAGQDVTIGLAQWEIQQATLNNLRQIAAARDQYKFENNRIANSVHELVGRKSYIKTLRSVNGEDYSALSMNPDDPLTVTNSSGLKVTYDPTGPNTTKPEYPPEVLRAQELGARVQPLLNQAVEAFRAANQNRVPQNERALIPYFATPKDGADFVEWLEAKKAAGL